MIVPEKEGRTIRDPEVDWDGKRIVFSMRDGRTDDYHVYVVNADGTGLRQHTRAKGVSDNDPAFLPDGDIVFSSTRDPKYCMCNRHIMCNLYRMEADGANIHQIGVSTLFEGHSSILPDGRILYDRWEYVDRDFGDAQGLWTCNPDGTRHAIWWGNNTTSPGGVINARAVGGDSSKAIAILGSCHDRPWGALGLIDRSRGVDGQEPVLRTWPASYRERIHAGGQEDFDSTRFLACKYADPFPIDETRFLAVRMTGRAGEMSLVYLDLDGNETELLADAPGIWSPVILRPTKKPVVQSQQRNFDAPDAPGKFYLQNVYIGTHMQGVKPGTVKALRVVESPPKRNWTGPRGWFGHGEEAAAMNWHSFENKRILGTVPVEADGSAYFEVPGNTFVYFQALDAEGKMVQSMRSGVNVQPGETYGCVGCHEKRVGEAAPVTERPLAMQRPPSKMNGWYGPARLFSFQKEVQPVLTKNCLKLRGPLGDRRDHMHRRRTGRDPAGLFVGLARLQAHAHAVRARQDEADGRGARPRDHVDGHQRAVLAYLRLRFRPELRRTHADHAGRVHRIDEADRCQDRQQPRRAPARTAELRPPRDVAHTPSRQGQARIRQGACDTQGRQGAAQDDPARRHGRLRALRGGPCARGALPAPPRR